MLRHGLYKDPSGKKSRLYHIWEDMKNRCYNAKNKRYHSYGGRGITVCDEWKNDFKVFYDWAHLNGYSAELTIDRIDVNGSYEPTNCKWSTQKQQGNNRTTNRRIELNGVVKTVAQWCDYKGMPYYVLKNRLKRGWSIERALNTPAEKHHKRTKYAA